MRTKFALPILGISLALLALSCNNESKQQNTAASQEQAGHEGHDHSQDAHGNEAPTAQNPATAPAVKAAALTIPEFTFFKVKSGMPFSKADIVAGKNTVFVLFDPNCGHCQNETTALAANYDKVKNVNIYYVSMNDPALMANFFKTFGKELEGKANVEMLYDKNQEFIRNFHIPGMFPANYVYAADGNLKKYWEGEKGINDIIADFNN